MRKIALISLALTGVLFFSLPAESQESYYPFSYAHLSYVQGDVRVDRGNDLGIEAGEVNFVLATGDKVMTADGLTEISFGRNNFLRLDAYSVVEIARLPESDNDDFALHLHQGRAYLRISYLSREKAFALHTPDASFYILENGLYRFEVEERGRTEVRVSEGSLEASGQDKTVLIEAGELISASNGYLLEPAKNAYSGEDDFSGWNSERDNLISRASFQSSSYLPEEINEYEPELSAYGRWVYERPYGYIWVPTVTYVDWRPYLLGRWMWYPRIGWTWVSAEPWGWAVYHYGRWQWRLGLGWYWIPTVHWGPAWVNWYWDADFVAWCPLTYWNRPLVIINNYVYERYYDDYYPVHSRALVIVRRNQLQARHSARTLVRPEQLRGVEKIRLETRQPQIRPVLSSTSLKPPALGSKSTVIRENTKNQVSRISRSNLSREASPSTTNSPGLKPSREKTANFPSRIKGEIPSERTIKPYSPSSVISRDHLTQYYNDRKKVSQPDNLTEERQRIRSSHNYSERSTPRSNWQNQERKSSSYNLPSLSRPYNQPSFRTKTESNQNRNFSPGRISQSQPIKSRASSSHNSSQAIRKKNS